MKSTSSLRYKDRHEDNPYVKDGQELIIQGRSKETIKLISSDYSDDTKIIRRYTLVDTEEFVKVYTGSLDKWLHLTRKAQSVLQYVLENLRPGKDKILINIKDLSEQTSYSSYGPLYSGINELIEAGLLARTTFDLVYYINPYFVFKGNRLLLAEEIEQSNIRSYPMAKEESYELPEGFDPNDEI